MTTATPLAPDLILAIDQGTQSVRAMLFDLNGQLVAKSQQHITPYFSKHPNWAEQNGDYFWLHLGQACQAFLGLPESSRGLTEAGPGSRQGPKDPIEPNMAPDGALRTKSAPRKGLEPRTGRAHGVLGPHGAL